jgi:hypothetical protein
MWNKVVEILKDPSYKQLGIAVCVSAILHAFLFSSFDFKLPNFKDDIYPIEARIQIVRSVASQLEKTKKEAIKPKPAPVKSPKPVEAPKLEEVAEPEKITDSPLEPAPNLATVVEGSISQQLDENAGSQVASETQPSDMSVVVNENTYQYVETDFDVRTEVDGSAQGRAKITYEVVEGSLYSLSFLVEPKGFFTLFVSNLLQTSKGQLTSSGLQPNSYSYQYGDNADKTRTANFDWQSKKLNLITSKITKTEELPDGTQDLLSFMYQFMYVAPLQKMQIPIATGKKLDIYDYSFEGEEVIKLPIGETKTIHILHSGSDIEEKTDLWLALDYQHLPVKIRKIEKNGRLYEFVATRISTNRSSVDQ